MQKIKELLGIVFGSSLIVEGGRTYAKLPVWLAVAVALWGGGMRLAIVTAVLVAALGMRARIVKG